MLSFYLALLDDDVEKARFTYIYETYGSDIWKISLGILRDTTSAIDAVDNTLFAISKNINCIPTEPSYEARPSPASPKLWRSSGRASVR